VPARLSPIERVRAEIDELFASDQDLGLILEQVARASVRLVLQTALEAEVSEFLGRDRYQRVTDPEVSAAARPGYRNGHQPLTIKTTSGPVTLERPKLRGTEVVFASRLLGKGVTRTNALESLVIAGYVRGLSTRDIEASLAEALGPDAAISRSTVSRVCEQIQGEFAAWRTRDLGGVDPLYVYVDASHFRYHEGARAEPVLCAWAITADGKPALLGLDGASAESTDACLDFLRDLTGRGLTEPLLVITDGAPGLISATEQVWPTALRQRCLVHRARNLVAKVSAADQNLVKADYWAIFDDLPAEPGKPAIAEARRRAECFAAAWRERYPRAVACVLDDLTELTAHLHFPPEHWVRIRHTNLIERTFGETRRRTKVIGRLPGERSCLSLVWAVLDRAGRGWRGVELRPASVRHLQQLRGDLHGRPVSRPGGGHASNAGGTAVTPAA
jgi:transposase-like protein